MLRFTVDVTAADAESRTIYGLAVPYGETAILNGTKYEFEPGSLELARARTPLLLGHDQSRPVGVLSERDDREDGLGVRFAIDATPDGDAALAQAQSGSRGGLSIGAEVDAYTELEGGVRSVTAARILEVSLVSLSAFEGAGVERVAAELEPEPDDDDDDQGDEPTTERDEPMPETLEAGHAPVLIAAAHDRPRLTAGEMALAIAGAQRGEPDATNIIRAALTESSIANLSGVLPPQYQTEILGGKTIARVLFGVFGGRPLPSSGLSVIKPVWGVKPAGDWIAANVGDAPSNAATIVTQTANVAGWAWGIAVPYMIATRSDPDAITSLYGGAVDDFHADVETLIATKLAAVAATAGVTTIGAAVAAFFAQSGRTPDVIVAAPDVWGKMADAKVLDAPSGLGAAVTQAGGLAASFAGLPVVVSGNVAATTIHLATRRAIDARVTEPVKLTANAIGALNIELGVIGEALADTDYPLEILTAAAVVLPFAAGTSGDTKGTK